MFARVRAEERLATQLVYEGRSAIEHFSPGAYFEVQAHPTVNPELRIVEVEHRLSQPVALRGRDTEEHYNNRFLAIEADLQYRPPRVTPVPRIYGIITGVIEPDIEGDVGKYAKIDEQGRYTVKFLFDTVAPGERKASRPVRRMQPSAGPNYGMHFPLRPGVEVAVTFVDGDPDRPLIVGAVPNPLTPTPVDQSTASKNRIKTESGVLFEIEDGSGS